MGEASIHFLRVAADRGPAVPVSPALLRRLWLAFTLGAASFAVTTLLGIAREGYDPWHQAVSALSLGPGGWIQALNLVSFGIVVLSTVPVWRRVLAGGKGQRAYPVLTALVGLSFVAVGLIPQDPAPGYDPEHLNLPAPTAPGLAHLAFAGVAALSSVVSLFVMAARFEGSPPWRGWPTYTRLASIAIILCVAVYGVWSTRASGYAGTFERAALLVPMLWMYAFLRTLGSGRPFATSTSDTERKIPA